MRPLHKAIALTAAVAGVLVLFGRPRPAEKQPSNALSPAVKDADTVVMDMREDYYDHGAFGRNGTELSDAAYRAQMDRFAAVLSNLRQLRAAASSTSSDAAVLDSDMRTLQEIAGGAVAYKFRRVIADTSRSTADRSFIAALLADAQTYHVQEATTPLTRLLHSLGLADAGDGRRPSF